MNTLFDLPLSSVLVVMDPSYTRGIVLLFRILAILVISPVLLLAFVDLIGWAIFKLIIRPLGFAKTIRFKDPEPSNLIIQSNQSSPNPSSDSSADSSPILAYKELEPSPSTTPIIKSSSPPSTLRNKKLKKRSGAYNSRAASIGVEGPLL